MRKILIFTDLDGTLLDYHTYSYTPAIDALRRVSNLKIPVILSSSKTRQEIAELRKKIGNTDPYVVENGGAVIIPPAYFRGYGEIETVKPFGPSYGKILKTLMNMRKDGHYSFRGFFDFSVEELAELTGLSTEQAFYAKQRLSTEPILWESSEENLIGFQVVLEKQGLRLVRGGRFHHVMGRIDKSAGVQWLIKRYRSDNPDTEFISVALGDSPNDEAMLRTADIAVVIKPVQGKPLDLSHSVSVIYTDKTGPEGWSEAVNQILDQYS